MSAYQALGAFEEKAATRYAALGSGSRSADGLPRESIRFEGVSFAYPGSERAVLDGLDLEIPAGGSLAIVGLNGAGKTTLIKLLARLYEPTAGRITVDGVDVRELDLASWRSRIAAIFQDFVHYELPVADNIGLGSVAHLGDEPAILRAAQRAGRDRGDRGASGGPRDAAVGALHRRRRRLGRPVAAHRALPRAVRARAGHVGARARRADRQPRRPRRGRAVRPLHRDHGRRDDDPHLAPLLDRAAGRPHRRARPRRDRRGGRPRRARRGRRALRGALPLQAARFTPMGTEDEP